MKFNSELPIHERIAEHRKQKRKRRCIVLLVFVFITVSFAAGLGKHLFQGNTDEKENREFSGSGQYQQQYAEGENEVISGNNDKPTALQEDSGSNSDTGEQNKYAYRSVMGDGIEYRDTNEKAREKDVRILKRNIENYIKEFQGQYGTYYINLNNGSEFGINNKDEYIAASTVKIPLNLYLFKNIENGSVNPEGLMTYTQKDYEGGTGSIQFEAVGSKYTIRELSKLSIEASDNIATNMLIRLLGRKKFKDYMNELDGTVLDYSSDIYSNISCPRDMALYMKKVYEFYCSNEKLGGELMNYFENTIFNERIPKLLPKEVRVAHKIGTQEDAFHDVGIVFTGEPYIISIMSKNVHDQAEAYDIIANISKKVYDFVVN
jgi:beta-lactamase class A